MNAVVFTALEGAPMAEAIGVSGDSIVAVGTGDEVVAALGDEAEVWDVGGRALVSGFHDHRVHVPEAGLFGSHCILPPERTANVYARLMARCASESDGAWVLAAGASLWNIDGTDSALLALLDDAVPARPALVIDDLGHAVWTNSAGLAAAGIVIDLTMLDGEAIYARREF